MSIALQVPARTRWRLFPLAMILCLLVVVAVNGVLAWAALSSFPGKAVEDDFGASNRYDQVLEKASRQAALGWVVQARVEDGHAVIDLSGPDGTPLVGATIAATAVRPLGPPQTMDPNFQAIAPGRYRAEAVLPQAGKWDLQLRLAVDGTSYSATRRVLVR
jgi:nitrogen fixation protein FixH